jgi:T cell receptor alpha chain V region
MITNFKENKVSSGRYTATLDANTKHSSLYITDSQPSDTASYICVVSAQCSLGTCSRYPNLLLEAGNEVRR